VRRGFVKGIFSGDGVCIGHILMGVFFIGHILRGGGLYRAYSDGRRFV